MRRSYITMIPRNDLRIPRETSPLSPIRNGESLNRQWIGIAQNASRTLAFGNKLSQLSAQMASPLQPGFSVNTDFFHPFKVYQPANLSNFVGVTALMIIPPIAQPPNAPAYSGAPVNCLITAANVPTNLAATPVPTVSIADEWRFICVRNGIVEYRPTYYQSLPSTGLTAAVPYDTNNWAIKFPVDDGVTLTGNGTDGLGIYGNSSQFDDATENTHYPPLVLGINPAGTIIGVSLWIQIIPETFANPTTGFKIYGSVFDYPTFPTFLPSINAAGGKYAIPLAELYINTSSASLITYQFLFDHVNNRYPVGTGNYYTTPYANGTNSTVMNYRGYTWPVSGNFSISPSDLASQLFYPGDVVWLFVDSNAGPITSNYINGYYMFTGENPSFPSSTQTHNGVKCFFPDNDSNWSIISQQAGEITF